VENVNDSMGGKVVLITGGTSGIGKAAATALAGMGAHVVITGRNEERGKQALQEIREESGNDGVELMLADLAVPPGWCCPSAPRRRTVSRCSWRSTTWLRFC
jgi:NAD(P)-dependent dehydrogenase (short-subunit alcohol dehydrogenase family)